MTPVIRLAPEPSISPLPLVCDSPHSGTHYPEDFGYAVDMAALRRSEDTHVDSLWSGVPQVGGRTVADNAMDIEPPVTYADLRALFEHLDRISARGYQCDHAFYPDSQLSPRAPAERGANARMARRRRCGV